MNFGDWASAISDVVQTAAIIIGGVWAYYKFIRGRTYHRRAEVDLDASLAALGSTEAILAHVRVENTGGAYIPFDVASVGLSSFTPGDVDERGQPNWKEVQRGKARVLIDDHAGIESQETISDDVLMPLPPSESDDQVVALRVTGKIFDKPRFGRKKGIRWTTNRVVPRERTGDFTREHGGGKEGAMGGVGQMPADDEERKKEKEAVGVPQRPRGLGEKLRRLFKGDQPDDAGEESDASAGTSG